nr:MAG TPA: hypothetical protein [Caudoviricetes sp.]
MALLNERFLPILFFAIFGNFRENVKKVKFLRPKTHFMAKNFYKNGRKI